MTKTQVDEKRYIMPELRRYDLLTMELIDKETHTQEVIDHIISSLPRYKSANMQAQTFSSKTNELKAEAPTHCSPNKTEAETPNSLVAKKPRHRVNIYGSIIEDFNCVICLEKCRLSSEALDSQSDLDQVESKESLMMKCS